MKPKHTKRSAHRYYADRPIKSRQDDILGRATFAARLAEDISSWEGSDSLVVALYGDWGSGKTSVKNMLVEASRKKKQSPLAVVDFNPWQLSGMGGIPTAFFRELGLALKREGPARDVDKRAKKWNAYAATLTIAGTAAEYVGKAMPLVGAPGGLIVESVGTGMKSAGAAAKSGSEALKAKQEAGVESLEEQKRGLTTLLARLPQPLLVVIDDIDRLTTDEILQVFQLVKANADFPKLIFLLLFERDVVTKALNQVSGSKGTEFLEKIVQVGYHVPHASQNDIQRVLFSGLDRYLEGTPAAKHWDKRRWHDLYVDGIAGYFRNLRHVYRFLGSFAFHIQQHLSKESIEVNPVDLIGLETLRVFEPGVYERLTSAKAVLTRNEENKLFGEIKQETVEAALTQIVSASTPEMQLRVKSILLNLFPPVHSNSAGEHGVSRFQSEWLRGLRICHTDLFDKYFTLEISNDDLSQAELDKLIALTADAGGFVAFCEALKKRGLLKITFSRLEAYKEHIPLQNMPAFILALCNLSDTFPAREPGLFATDIEMHASRLVYFGLKREPDFKKRFDTLSSAFVRSNGLALPVKILSLNERTGDREERGHEFLVNKEDLPELRSICVEKFRTASKDANFRHDQRLENYLWRWSEWSTVDEVRRWVAQHTQTPQGAVWLLTTLMGESHAWGNTHRVRHYIQLSSIERFADLSNVAQLVDQVKEPDLSKNEAIAVVEFQKALNRRAEGKADDSWKNMQDDFEETGD